MERIPVIQGDVLLWPVDSIPDGGEVVPGEVHVLALGERTGHSHVIHGATLTVVGEDRYVMVAEGPPGTTMIRHEDHGPDIVLPGAWQVRGQVEHDLMGGLRRVAD